MADYSFFMMGAAAVGVALLLVIAAIVTACVSKRFHGLIGLILAIFTPITFGLTILPALVFSVMGIRRKSVPKLGWAGVAVSILLPAALLFHPEARGRQRKTLSVSSGALQPYSAVFSVNRSQMGFPPLPTNGEAMVDTIDRQNWAKSYPPPNYDVILAFYADPQGHRRTERSVALKKAGDDYQWVHEQMLFHGPKTYTTIDGTFNEQIVITCEKEQVAFIGTALQGTAISYSGTDPRLSGGTPHTDNLTISQIAPILREWGYDYNADNAQPTAEGDGPRPAP